MLNLASDLTYYQHSAPARAPTPALQGRHEAEVCVIGGGFAGLSTALGLIERGVRGVVLLEAEHIGHGASGRNGGFVFGGYSLGNEALLRQLGRERARALYGLTLDAVARIRQRIAHYGMDCDVNEGGVLLAHWFRDPTALDRLHDFMRREFDVDWTRLSPAATRERLHSTRYHGALHERQAFHFHPLKYAHGLAAAVLAQGGAVFEHSRVRRIVPDGGGQRVELEGAQVHARHVVVCCGGYIESLQPALARAVLPIATYVMATEPLGERLQDAMTTGAAVYDTRFAFDYYRPLPDTRLLWGGRISIRQRTPPQVARLLHADLLKVYPQLAGVRVEYAWSGLMSYARHQMPQIGRLPGGPWYAMGFGGHGVGPTTLAGELLAQAIADGKARPAGFDRYGLPPVWGWLGLLAAQLSYWQAELRDRWRP